MGTEELSNDAFAKRMQERRTRAKFPELPKDILACGVCAGSGVLAGRSCTKCEGWGFHREDGSIAEIHSAKGGFYRWGAIDAVVETMMNAKLAYAGPVDPGDTMLYKTHQKRTFHCAYGLELRDLIHEAESTRFSLRYQKALNGTELWMHPTPAPERARLRVRVEPEDEDAGNFVVWCREERHQYPVFLYRACDHHAAMIDEKIDRRERLALMLDSDGGRYLSHPGHDNVGTATPRFRTLTMKLLPVMGDQPATKHTYRLDTDAGVAKVTDEISRAQGPIAVSYDLRPELGRDIWTYQSMVEVLSL